MDTFNVVVTGNTFWHLRYFVASLVDQSDATYRLVANGCTAESISDMRSFADRHRDRVDFMEVSAVMVAHGVALDGVLRERDDGERFCFVDPDIKAKGPFLDDFRRELETCDAVTAGREVWTDENVLPPGQVGVGGRHFFDSTGFALGSPHFAMYRRRPLEETMRRWGVGFGAAGPELTPAARARLEAAGHLYLVYDTAKIVNILFQLDGHTLRHREHPALVHVGGLSHFLAPAEGEPSGEVQDPHWAAHASVRARLEVARHAPRSCAARSRTDRSRRSPRRSSPSCAHAASTWAPSSWSSSSGTGTGDGPGEKITLRYTPSVSSPGEADEARAPDETATGERTITRDELDAYLHRELGALHRDADTYRVLHTVQVTSFGGSGTSALCEHLLDAGVQLQPGPAQWPFKHLRYPPSQDEVPDGFRVVYPLADPRDAVLSVFRRGLQVGHYRSLWGYEPGAEVLARLRDRDSFLEAGIDDFGLRDHMHRWLEHPPGYEVMFIRYDRLSEAWSELATFVGLPDDAPAMIWRPRGSNWEQLDDDARRSIEAMYGDLASEIAALPATLVV